jgi:hypothetical protein
MDELQKNLHDDLKEIIIDLVWEAYTEKQILDLVKRYYKSGIKEWEENVASFKGLIEEDENDNY